MGGGYFLGSVCSYIFHLIRSSVRLTIPFRLRPSPREAPDSGISMLRELRLFRTPRATGTPWKLGALRMRRKRCVFGAFSGADRLDDPE